MSSLLRHPIPTSYTFTDASREPKTTTEAGERTEDVQLENGGGDHVGDMARAGDDVAARLEVAAGKRRR